MEYFISLMDGMGAWGVIVKAVLALTAALLMVVGPFGFLLWAAHQQEQR